MSSSYLQQRKRSRSGCWTCRTRKKKCDGEDFPCKNCVRLGLVCDRGTKLVWEDDARRKGMQRRGPQRTLHVPPGSRSECIDPTYRSKSYDAAPDEGSCDKYSDRIPSETQTHVNTTTSSLASLFRPSNIPELTTHESFLLDHYIQRFSRIYPTCSSPSNPFLSILLPLATQHYAVMSAVLALSGAQFEAHCDLALAKATLRARHRALQGCRTLLICSGSVKGLNRESPGEPRMDLSSSNNILFTLACCICLLLYEKLVGDGKANWMPHLAFLAEMFEQLETSGNSTIMDSIQRDDQQRQAFDFIHHLFLYNDLVQSTAQRSSTLSKFYLRPGSTRSLAAIQHASIASAVEQTIPSPAPNFQRDEPSKHGRFYYPYLVARISAGEETISDGCIDKWDGRLDWLPSFSLLGLSEPFNSMTSDTGAGMEYLWDLTERDDPVGTLGLDHSSLMVSLYRDTAKVYLRQCLRRRRGHETMSQHGSDVVELACHATFLISQLPDGSSFENALLWPIGIIGPELTAVKDTERQYLLDRLWSLEQRFQMRHFERVREVLKKGWNRPALISSVEEDFRRSHHDEDVFLFG